MKKTLLFLGTAALMASCTQEELIPNESAQNVAKGIVFEAAGESATRGEMDKSEDGLYRFIWYAEEDRINVYASNVKVAGSNTGYGVLNTTFEGAFHLIDGAEYKATKSGSQGLFTAASDEQWIAFQNDAKIHTIATYNVDLDGVVAESGTENISGTNYPVTKKIKQINLCSHVSSVQNSPLNYVKAPMLSNTEGRREKNYHSVGEKMNLDFYRIYPIVAFSGVSGNDAFNNDLGALQSVTLESGSFVKPTDDHIIPANLGSLAGQATYTVKYTDAGEAHSFNKTVDLKDFVTVNVGETWTSDKRVYMAILPVNRTVTKNDGKDAKQATQNMTIKYKYANATLEQNLSTNKDWETPHQVIAAPALDIADKYPYIVTEDIDNVNGGIQRKLIVNKGNVKDAFLNDAYIKWQSETSENVTIGSTVHKGIKVGEITEVEIRANVNALTANDYAKLNKLTGVTKLVVKNATTTITYNALSALSNLAELQMDNVTTIEFTNETAKKTPVNTTKLATVKLPKFNFATSKAITRSILIEGVLTTLDMSGTPTMKEQFPYDGMSLAGYTKLATVTVQDGVVLGPESFKGCTALATVTGYVNLGGYGAFEGCSSLTSISIDETTNKIPSQTFKNATKLANVYKKDGKTAIQPSIIGDEAFYNTVANIDLTASTTIGKSAFAYNTALMGVKFGATGSDKYQLVVSAAEVGETAFYNASKLQYVKFSNLETVTRKMLTGTAMKELKFAKVFTFAENADKTVFGTTSDTKLFVNPSQVYSGNTIAVNGQTITFQTIIEEEE